MSAFPIEKRDQRMTLGAPLRWARKSDANEMAELINFAGEGLPLYLWSSMNDGTRSDWEIGRERAQRDFGSFSYRNTVVSDRAGRAIAALIGYDLPSEADPSVYVDMPKMFVPLQELEDLALSTWYVNVLAAYPAYRGQGHGTQLLGVAKRIALDRGCTGLSIIVSDQNHGARRLYERFGFRETARRDIVKDDWEHNGNEWVLMIKREISHQ
ncbi:MAG: GNAT family N-acetyltransferase [Pseudomonadota bacterium]